MLDYLKKYKQLIKQLENKKKEIQDINMLLNEIHAKCLSSEEVKNKLEKENKELNNNYEILMNQLIKKSKIIIIGFLCAIYIASIIISLINYGIGALLFIPVYIAGGGIVYLVSFILEKCSYFFENFFKKYKDIYELLEQIKENEKQLSNAKEILKKHRNEYDALFTESLKINNELIDIEQSIDKLKISYATPFFEEKNITPQKTYNKELKDEEKTSTKKRNR